MELLIEVMGDKVTDIGGLKAVIDEILLTLSPTEKKFIDLRFGLSSGYCLTYTQIAKTLGTTKVRVSRHVRKGLRELRHPSRSKKLAPFIHAVEQTEIKLKNYTDRFMLDEHVIKAEHGLLAEDEWITFLSGYDTRLFRWIRSELSKVIPSLIEKFNRRQRGQYYFGYCRGGPPDRLYIYFQRRKLVVDVALDSAHANQLISIGFGVSLRKNWQGKIGWLTGWNIPYNIGWEKRQEILKFMLEAFQK